jgi:hypothetical protein
MNPYLEHPAIWHDFRERFMPLAAEFIGSQVLPRYFVKIDQHLYIHQPDAAERLFIGRGDVAVTPGVPTAVTDQTATQILEAPEQVEQVVVDEERVSFLEIRDRDSRQLITVVELLSPSNKYAGPDREQYLGKHYNLLKTAANLVEIDLLRGGPRMPWLNLPPCAYCVVVSRWYRRPRAGAWPIDLRDRLPVIPVPLKQGEADATLDLQQVLHRIYDVAGYAYYIYTNELEPALSAEDAVWARGLLAGPA